MHIGRSTIDCQSMELANGKFTSRVLLGWEDAASHRERIIELGGEFESADEAEAFAEAEFMRRLETKAL